MTEAQQLKAKFKMWYENVQHLYELQKKCVESNKSLGIDVPMAQVELDVLENNFKLLYAMKKDFE